MPEDDCGRTSASCYHLGQPLHVVDRPGPWREGRENKALKMPYPESSETIANLKRHSVSAFRPFAVVLVAVALVPVALVPVLIVLGAAPGFAATVTIAAANAAGTAYVAGRESDNAFKIPLGGSPPRRREIALAQFLADVAATARRATVAPAIPTAAPSPRCPS